MISGAIYADITERITKDEIIEFYKAYIHPSSPDRTKLSIFMHSQLKQRSTVKFSVTAFELFIQELELAQVPTANLEHASSPEADAPLDKTIEFFSQHIDRYNFITEEKKAELLAMIKNLAVLHPVTGMSWPSREVDGTDDEKELREGTVVVDLVAFKQSLKNAELPLPVISLEPELVEVALESHENQPVKAVDEISDL